MNSSQCNCLDSKILIIDDDHVSNLLVETILHNKGFHNILSITNPLIAADKYIEFVPDLILLDLMMPEMNGFEVYNQLSLVSANQMLPVIMITAKNDHLNKDYALNLGISHFLEKPINSSELLAIIHNSLKINHLYKITSNRANVLEQNLNKLEDDLVNTLLLSVKFRDQETGEHINRVSNIVKILALGSAVDEENAIMIAVASKLHDIGKIGIPDEILIKADALNLEEWEFMKKHTTIGESILSVHESELMQLAANIAKSHHENWDGTGYPLQLKGKEIPFPGRLVAIADVFDALLTERPYKKAWSEEQAISYIENQAGYKFDPDLVKVFISNLNEIIALYSSANLIYN